MTILEKKEVLKKELLKAKAEGLRAFINKSQNSVYGFMTDGTNMISVQFSDYFYGFNTTFKYVPKRNTGSGCSTLDRSDCYKELNKDIFLESVNLGKRNAFRYHAEFYKNFEHYLKRNSDFYTFYTEL